MLEDVFTAKLGKTSRRQWGGVIQWAWFLSIMGGLLASVWLVEAGLWWWYRRGQWRAFWQWQRLVELAVPLIIGILSWLIFKFQKNARNAIQNHDAVFFEKSLYWLGYWFIALALACMLALAFLSLVLYVLIVH